MLVMILESCPASLKGALSRWLIEPKTGVFLGNPSARVRDELWQMAIHRAKDGRVVQIWSDRRCPQGYRHRSYGDRDRALVDMEGIALVRQRPKSKKAAKAGQSKAKDP